MDAIDIRLLIDGAWCEAAGGATLPITNPATGATIGRVARAGVADLDRAAAAAARGFALWRGTPALERSAVLRGAASLLRERADAIARTMTIEQGKPLAESRVEVIAGAETLEWFAEEARRAYGRVVPSRARDVRQLVLREPVGPVAAFTPWNFPINQIVRKLGAALAAGCSIVVKGPEDTPGSPAALFAALADAGVPPGVANLVFGDPATVSAHLIAHPAIRKISFTGSVAVGKQLAALAGAHMKRATMELGGHAPVIVLDDADLDAAAAAMLLAKRRNAGQVCIAPTRFLLDRRVHDAFLDRYLPLVEAIRVGDGLEDGVEMGPLVSERRRDAVQGLVDDAVAGGARLRVGGERIGNQGHFFAPTVLTGVTPAMRAMNEEPFGPVSLAVAVDGIDGAIAEANRLPFGLAAYAFSRSSSRVAALGERLEAGMVSVNGAGLSFPEIPFGGVKDSGYGSEGGSEAIEPYLVAKSVAERLL